MLSVAARQLARSNHGLVASRIAPRAFASAAADKSTEELARFEPGEWFQDFSDPQIRSQLNKLRDLENDIISTVSPKMDTSLDWSEWESEIKYPGLVKELKAIHDKVPIPDVDEEKAQLSKKLDDIFNPIMAEFAQLAKEAEAETLQLEERANEVTYLRDNLNKLSVDEFLEKYPSVKASIEDDIANNRWFVNE